MIREDVKLELTSRRFWTEVGAEFLATLLFLTMVCGTVLSWNNSPPSVIHIAFSHGLSIATLAMAVGHISGGHLNPAVSIAMMAAGKITPMKSLFFIIAQCIGAICGSAIVYGLTPGEVHGALGVTSRASNVSIMQAFGVELVLTFILVFTIFAATDPDRGLTGYGVPLAIGICVFICLMFGIPPTGASLNPARSLGPAVVTNSWRDHWIYWVAPVLGGLIAATVYSLLFANKIFSRELSIQSSPGHENGNVPVAMEIKPREEQEIVVDLKTYANYGMRDM